MTPSANPPATRITIIAAVARNRVIGRENALPWRLPEDLKHFKAVTIGHPVIMGRNTWESLGRPLPGRRNVVITRAAGYAASGADVTRSLDAALALCGPVPEVFVIGGARIYALALARAQRLLITEIGLEPEGDTLFPEWDRAQWVETSREPHRAEAGFEYAFVSYERRRT